MKFFVYITFNFQSLFYKSCRDNKVTMNTKTALAIFSIVALVTAMMASTVVTTAFAQADNEKQGGPKAQQNHGQCKQVFNDNPCKRFHTGSD